MATMAGSRSTRQNGWYDAMYAQKKPNIDKKKENPGCPLMVDPAQCKCRRFVYLFPCPSPKNAGGVAFCLSSYVEGEWRDVACGAWMVCHRV
jgi:hypothetical protein